MSFSINIFLMKKLIFLLLYMIDLLNYFVKSRVFIDLKNN